MPAPVKGRRGEAGYNLVVLMVFLTVVNILIAAAMPKWSHVIRREKEEELISRGFQYAEAIRVFQNRFQRLPVRLEELIETEPRSIRKLWKDPMTDDGGWALIPPGPAGSMQPQPPGGIGGDPANQGNQGGVDLDDGRGDEPGEALDSDTPDSRKKGAVSVGPFVGVHSRSSDESILIFYGRDRYDQWHFRLDLLMKTGADGNLGGQPGPGSTGSGLELSTRWLGRPLPEFLQGPQGQLPTPEDQLPKDNLGRRRRPPANRNNPSDNG